jgi:hypothetical protein
LGILLRIYSGKSATERSQIFGERGMCCKYGSVDSEPKNPRTLQGTGGGKVRTASALMGTCNSRYNFFCPGTNLTITWKQRHRKPWGPLSFLRCLVEGQWLYVHLMRGDKLRNNGDLPELIYLVSQLFFIFMLVAY